MNTKWEIVKRRDHQWLAISPTRERRSCQSHTAAVDYVNDKLFRAWLDYCASPPSCTSPSAVCRCAWCKRWRRRPGLYPNLQAGRRQ